MESAKIVAFLRQMLEKVDAEKVADVTSISQFNIRMDGEVAATYVFRARDQRIDEEAADDATVVVTIDDADFVALFKSDAMLEQLLADGRITVSGDEAELALIDKRRQAELKALKAAQEAE